jgi:uncharacterized repeat protein (TIGR02543 family)
VVRLSGDVGAFSWDKDTGYYVIAAGKNAKYWFIVICEGSPQGPLNTPAEDYISLPNGGLVDDEGNLIVGATPSDVSADGTITLPNGGTIVTPEGTYVFDGAASIKDNQIITTGNYTYDKNIASYDPDTGAATILTPIHTPVTVPAGGYVIINTVGGGTQYYPPAPTIYTVSFVDYDGTVLATRTVNSGSSATAPEAPTRTGYTFTGWSGSFTNVTGNLELTAQYTINTYTVTFQDYNGNNIGAPQTVNYGANATAPANPTRTGYTFTGWNGSLTNVTGNLELTAQYRINTYTVTFVNYNSNVLKTQTVNYGASATAPANPTRANYTFTGWSRGYTNVTSDITVTAVFERNATTGTTTGNTGNTTTGNTDTTTGNTGATGATGGGTTTVYLQSPPAAGIDPAATTTETPDATEIGETGTPLSDGQSNSATEPSTNTGVESIGDGQTPQDSGEGIPADGKIGSDDGNTLKVVLITLGIILLLAAIIGGLIYYLLPRRRKNMD